MVDYDAVRVTVHVTVIESPAAFVTVPNTIRHNIVPLELALKTPASTIDAVAVPAGKVAAYTIVDVDGVPPDVVNATRPSSETNAVFPAAAAVLPDPRQQDYLLSVYLLDSLLNRKFQT